MDSRVKEIKNAEGIQSTGCNLSLGKHGSSLRRWHFIWQRLEEGERVSHVATWKKKALGRGYGLCTSAKVPDCGWKQQGDLYGWRRVNKAKKQEIRSELREHQILQRPIDVWVLPRERCGIFSKRVLDLKASVWLLNWQWTVGKQVRNRD